MITRRDDLNQIKRIFLDCTKHSSSSVTITSAEDEFQCHLSECYLEAEGSEKLVISLPNGNCLFLPKTAMNENSLNKEKCILDAMSALGLNAQQFSNVKIKVQDEYASHETQALMAKGFRYLAKDKHAIIYNQKASKKTTWHQRFSRIEILPSHPEEFDDKKYVSKETIYALYVKKEDGNDEYTLKFYNEDHTLSSMGPLINNQKTSEESFKDLSKEMRESLAKQFTIFGKYLYDNDNIIHDDDTNYFKFLFFIVQIDPNIAQTDTINFNKQCLHMASLISNGEMHTSYFQNMLKEHLLENILCKAFNLPIKFLQHCDDSEHHFITTSSLQEAPLVIRYLFWDILMDFKQSSLQSDLNQALPAPYGMLNLPIIPSSDDRFFSTLVDELAQNSTRLITSILHSLMLFERDHEKNATLETLTQNENVLLLKNIIKQAISDPRFLKSALESATEKVTQYLASYLDHLEMSIKNNNHLTINMATIAEIKKSVASTGNQTLIDRTNSLFQNTKTRQGPPPLPFFDRAKLVATKPKEGSARYNYYRKIGRITTP